MISQKTEEVLERLYIEIIEQKKKGLACDELKIKQDGSEYTELIKKNLAQDKGGILKLTKEGELEARDVVRRHRLAERLMTDLFDLKGVCVHESACEFEHILHRGIDEQICRLLGHPRTCPHGTRIPEGKCCKEKGIKNIRVIAPLSLVKPGEKGKISYIQSEDKNKLQTIMAMGVLPGMEIILLQNFPSYLFKVGNSQFAVDEDVAKDVYVRITK
ncbi:MAG: metal-dependent transcriptional regulator [Candidatus Firestonebacteria bacterium]